MFNAIYSHLCQKLIFSAILLFPLRGFACKQEAPVVQLLNNIKIEVSAQSGLRLSGKNTKPSILRIKSAEESNKIPLVVETQVTEMKNTVPLWKRATGTAPEFQEVQLPLLIEIRPERVLESDLNYVIDLKEEDKNFQIEVLFRGGMSKSRGCGGSAKVEARKATH